MSCRWVDNDNRIGIIAVWNPVLRKPSLITVPILFVFFYYYQPTYLIMACYLANTPFHMCTECMSNPG